MVLNETCTYNTCCLPTGTNCTQPSLYLVCGYDLEKLFFLSHHPPTQLIQMTIKWSWFKDWALHESWNMQNIVKAQHKKGKAIRRADQAAVLLSWWSSHGVHVCPSNTLGSRESWHYHTEAHIVWLRYICGNGSYVWPVNKPEAQPILVNMDMVTPCSAESPDVSWLGLRRKGGVYCYHQPRSQNQSCAKNRVTTWDPVTHPMACENWEHVLWYC